MKNSYKLPNKIRIIINKILSIYCKYFHKNYEEFYDPTYYYNMKPIIKESIKEIPVYLNIKNSSEYQVSYSKVYIELDGLQWKDKFRSPRHEYNPHLTIKFFNKIFELEWTTKDFLYDTTYWETVLDIAVYNRTVLEAVNLNTWDATENNPQETNLKTMGYLKNMF